LTLGSDFIFNLTGLCIVGTFRLLFVQLTN